MIGRQQSTLFNIGVNPVGGFGMIWINYHYDTNRNTHCRACAIHHGGRLYRGERVLSMVSRNPEDYAPTRHARQRKRERNIAWVDAAEAIRDGRVEPEGKEHRRIFVKEFPNYPKPLAVVVDIERELVVTVEFYYGD